MAAYAYLAAAAAFNVAGIYFLRLSNGFAALWAGLLALLLIGITQWLFSHAMQGVGVAIGTTALLALIMAGSTLLGVTVFGEPVSITRATGLTLALLGICVAQLA